MCAHDSIIRVVRVSDTGRGPFGGRLGHHWELYTSRDGMLPTGISTSGRFSRCWRAAYRMALDCGDASVAVGTGADHIPLHGHQPRLRSCSMYLGLRRAGLPERLLTSMVVFWLTLLISSVLVRDLAVVFASAAGTVAFARPLLMVRVGRLAVFVFPHEAPLAMRLVRAPIRCVRHSDTAVCVSGSTGIELGDLSDEQLVSVSLVLGAACPA
ncbi:MAG: hypothetical protein AB7K09_08085 [Planctomycetota bacterium]